MGERGENEGNGIVGVEKAPVLAVRGERAEDMGDLEAEVTCGSGELGRREVGLEGAMTEAVGIEMMAE